jgi:MoaA/NifB/PqqE/SkfB family radical SAM enzyme
MIVVWRVTTRCNLACPFCAYDRRLPFARTDADPGSIRRILGILADYQNTGGDPVLVSWLGGEPLLWPVLPELTVHATSLGLRVSATTNGTTLGSASVRRHLLDHYSELTISLDAPDASHDALRSSPGLFEALRENVSELSRARRAAARPMKLRANTVLLRQTIARFPEIAREVASWGVDELTFNILGGRDRPEYFPDHRPLAGQLAAFSSQMSSLRRDPILRGLTIAGSPAYLDRLHSSASGLFRPVTDCGPAERFLFIDEHGSVSPCSFTSGDLSLPLDEIRNVSDLVSLPVRFASSRTIRRPRVCDDCPSTQVFEKFAPSI